MGWAERWLEEAGSHPGEMRSGLYPQGRAWSGRLALAAAWGTGALRAGVLPGEIRRAANVGTGNSGSDRRTVHGKSRSTAPQLVLSEFRVAQPGIWGCGR